MEFDIKLKKHKEYEDRYDIHEGDGMFLGFIEVNNKNFEMSYCHFENGYSISIVELECICREIRNLSKYRKPKNIKLETLK